MILLTLALIGCGSSHEEPVEMSPAEVELPPGPPRGKAPPPKGAKAERSGNPNKAGKASGGEGAGGSELGLAFNNADSVCRTQDGGAHELFVQEGALVYQREGGTKATLDDAEVSLMCLATDSEQTLLAAWASGRPPRIHAAWSRDGGETWGAAEELPQAVGNGPTSRIWTGKGGQRALVAWHTPNGGPGGREATQRVRASTWSDGKWTAPVTLDQSEYGASWVALAPDGPKTLAAWKEKKGGKGEGHTLAMATYDGRAWSAPHSLGIDGADPGLCVTRSGRIHLGFHDEMKAWRTYSDDGGATWAKPKLMDDGLFVQAECSGDTVLFLFERKLGEGPIQDDSLKTVAAYRSVDNGAHFEALPLDAQAGQVRPSALLQPDGGVELRYIDTSGAEKSMGKKAVPAP